MWGCHFKGANADVPYPLGGGAFAYEETYGWKLDCGHPSRRPPAAGPQDEG